VIETRKAAYPQIFNGSTRKHKPGDRGGSVNNSTRYGKNMHPEALPRLKELYDLSMADIMDILNCGKSTVQAMLGKRKTGRNFSISKKSFWMIVEAIEPKDYFNWFNVGIGNIDDAIPAEIENLVFKCSSKLNKRAV
jgi:hypothetical protein